MTTLLTILQRIQPKVTMKIAAIRSGRNAAILVANAFHAPVTVTTGFIKLLLVHSNRDLSHRGILEDCQLRAPVTPANRLESTSTAHYSRWTSVFCESGIAV